MVAAKHSADVVPRKRITILACWKRVSVPWAIGKGCEAMSRGCFNINICSCMQYSVMLPGAPGRCCALQRVPQYLHADGVRMPTES